MVHENTKHALKIQILTMMQKMRENFNSLCGKVQDLQQNKNDQDGQFSGDILVRSLDILRPFMDIIMVQRKSMRMIGKWS